MLQGQGTAVLPVIASFALYYIVFRQRHYHHGKTQCEKTARRLEFQTPDS